MLKKLIENQVPRRFLIGLITRQCSSFIDDQYFSTLKKDCHNEIEIHEPEVATLFKNSSEARTIDLTEKLDDFSYIDQQYFKGNLANSLFTSKRLISFLQVTNYPANQSKSKFALRKTTRMT